MKTRVKSILFIQILIGYLLLAGCGDNDDTVHILRVSHGLNRIHPLHQTLKYFARRVEDLSYGTLVVKLYPDSQLGSDRESLEMLQYGILSMAISSCGPLESFIPQMQIFGIPYLFQDAEHAFSVLDGPIGRELLDSGATYGLRGLCFYDAGARSFYTRATPVNHPDDLAGLKIRVMRTPMSIKTVQAFGALATPIDWGELYTALQQGVVDGAENNPPSFATSRHYEICKHYTLNEHLRIPDMLLISELFWQRLTERQKQIVQQAARESVQFQRQLWHQTEIEVLAALAEAGVEIIHPDKTSFIQRAKSVWAEFENTPTGRLIQRIQESLP